MTADFVSVSFIGNSAVENGGGIFNTHGNMSLTNVLMQGNTARYCGGAIHNFAGNLAVRQSTIAGNTAEGGSSAGSCGGGIYNGTGRLNVTGSICAANVSDVDPDVSVFPANLTVEDSIIGDTQYRKVDGGVETTTVLPQMLFVGDPRTTTDPLADLKLAEGSPAVDAAAAALLPEDIFDVDGDANTEESLPYDLVEAVRFLGESLDLGAFERPVTSDEPVLEGDLNGDGFVNASDLDLIRANWGNTVQPGDLLSGDANADGTVNAADLDVVRANWGAVAVADAVFDSLADEPAYGNPVYNEPVYGPALPETATVEGDVRLTPRWLEALAAEAWKRERERGKDEG